MMAASMQASQTMRGRDARSPTWRRLAGAVVAVLSVLASAAIGGSGVRAAARTAPVVSIELSVYALTPADDLALPPEQANRDDRQRPNTTYDDPHAAASAAGTFLASPSASPSAWRPAPVMRAPGGPDLRLDPRGPPAGAPVVFLS